MIAASRILLVEDTLELREDLKFVLEDSGYTVVEAESGQAALSAFREARPDLVICDIQLPDTDGLFVLKSIRTCQSGYDQMPVIVVSAFSDPKLRREAEALGIDGFILKPVDYSDLLKLISQSLPDSAAISET